MRKKVIVFGHADADGHVIADQTARNLSQVPSFDVEMVVDPVRTRGHASWLEVAALTEVEAADIVFFVDLMFSPRDFAIEADALVDWVTSYPEKQFFLIDHHPLPLSRLSRAPNLRAIYRQNVFHCTIGERSGEMVLAALDENQASNVSDVLEDYHKTISMGLKRAAAPGGGLSGAPLLCLIQQDCWSDFHDLGLDDREFHRLVRGRRPTNDPTSETFRNIKSKAELLAKNFVNNSVPINKNQRRGKMPYDVAEERFETRDGRPISRRNEPLPKADLEVLVTLMEIAALALTDRPESTFTKAQLLEEAKKLAGDEFEFDKSDVDVVLKKASFVKSTGKEFCLR